jgi:hypothetical protein
LTTTAINGAQFAFGTLLSGRVKSDPTQIFEYWLKVCLTRELGAVMEARSTASVKGPSTEDFVSYCAINKLRSSRYVARFATAYIRAYLGIQAGKQQTTTAKVSYATNSWHGTIPLYGFAAKKAKKDRIDYVLDKSDYFTKVMGYLPLSGATNHSGESLPIYSFYNLLGVLGEIVLAARSTKNTMEAVKEVRRTIVKNSQFREYPLPGWALSLSSDDDQAADNAEEGDSIVEDIERVSSVFATKLAEWARPENADFNVSPAVLGKAFTRFFYSTNHMDKELANEKKLGNWMHRMVVVFLNSVLIVEAMEKLNLTNSRLNLKNPVGRDTIFIENLTKINKSERKSLLSFSSWLFSCPIWKVYMKDKFDCPDSIKDADDQFSLFVNGVKIPVAEESSSPAYGLNNQLNKIAVKIYEPMQRKKSTRKSKPKVPAIPKLPNYSVSLSECRDDFIKVCMAEGIGLEQILTKNEDQIVEFLKEKLSYKYNPGSINGRTVKSIAARLLEGQWQL